ncbi:MAG: DUF4332 domain-containing protein [Chloroflexi bacterium]|nr:DUF4332 domain-containing protein [Chloroflexota bacterium]
MRNIPLRAVEGIGPVYADKLAAIGILTAQDLLEKGGTPQGRKAIAERTQISPKLILEWVNHVDLFRIKGIGPEYADLLEAAGVDTVVDLARRNPENLYQRLQEVNQAKHLVRRMPSLEQVRAWIEQARTMPRKVFY